MCFGVLIRKIKNKLLFLKLYLQKTKTEKKEFLKSKKSVKKEARFIISMKNVFISSN